jgi:hypothetical protein
VLEPIWFELGYLLSRINSISAVDTWEGAMYAYVYIGLYVHIFHHHHHHHLRACPLHSGFP